MLSRIWPIPGPIATLSTCNFIQGKQESWQGCWLLFLVCPLVAVTESKFPGENISNVGHFSSYSYTNSIHCTITWQAPLKITIIYYDCSLNSQDAFTEEYFAIHFFKMKFKTPTKAKSLSFLGFAIVNVAHTPWWACVWQLLIKSCCVPKLCQLHLKFAYLEGFTFLCLKCLITLIRKMFRGALTQ